MGLICEQDWNALSRKFSNAPFPSISIENFLDENRVREIARSYPSFQDAQKWGREFSKVNERGKVQVTQPELFPDAVADLSKTLSSKEFISNLERLSGISNLVWDPGFSGGGMHLTRARGHLDVHVDFNYSDELKMHRRLNLLLYLNESWSEEWGGQLELWENDVTHCFQTVTPNINNCVIFATDERSFHGVRAVTGPDDTTRNSFAVYYYTVEPPANWTGDKHSTVFRARPNEKLKRYVLMPLEVLQESYVARKFRGLLNRLRG